MYSPKFNLVHDRAILLDAMREHSFATLFGPLSVQPPDETASATHLPLIVKDEGEHGLIEGHFAKANPHWRALAGRETLIVFPGHTAMFRQPFTSRSSPSPPGTTSPSTPMARFRWLKTIPAKRPSSPISSPQMSLLTSTTGTHCLMAFAAPCWPASSAFAFPSRALRASSRSARIASRRSVATCTLLTPPARPTSRPLRDGWSASPHST